MPTTKQPRGTKRSGKKRGPCPETPISAILKTRANEVANRAIEYISNPEFRKRNSEQMILDKALHSEKTFHIPKRRRPENIPAYFATLYETPLLTAEEEQLLFQQFNFLKFRAETLRSQLNIDNPDEDLLDKIEGYLKQAHEAWERLVQSNLRLVVSIARRFVDANHSFDELVSDGQLALMNAIEKFDYSRGFRFSTYATHAIQRCYYRKIKTRHRDMARFKSMSAEILEEVPDRFGDEEAPVEDYQRIQNLMEWIEDELDERERYIIAARFGFNRDLDSHTLRTIGQELGISKERVRQIQLRAIDKLQELAGVDSTVDVLDDDER